MGREWTVGDARSLVHRFTAEELRAFAELTGDRNPLHVDAQFAEGTPLVLPVVHGMLAASFVSTLIGMELPGPGALWNDLTISWRRPIRVDTELRIGAKVVAVHRSTDTLSLAIEGRGADDEVLYFEAKARVTMLNEAPAAGPSGIIAGKRFLVTGASGFVGGEICAHLAGAGARVVPWGRSQERFSERFGGEIFDGFRQVDLRDGDSVEAAVAAELASGGIDGFVHAAAPPARFLAIDDAQSPNELREHWLIGVESFHRIVRVIVPLMPAGGTIVAILTECVFDAPPANLSAYVTTKMALWGLVRSLAVELGVRGIRVNAVSPGLMNTPYTADRPLRAKQVAAATNPLRRLCEPSDVASAVTYLCGPGASFITGVNMSVTGGVAMP